ncbi:MAG: hypothetical protein ACI4GO_10360 [Hominenteromicrobium sp.]
MDRIELHDVEYGDCTVLVGRNRSVLMVDCGSVSRYARRGEEEIRRRFEAIFSRYAGAAQRQFLLTHYHRDHMNGFLWQLRQDPQYFDRVYLPALPDGKHGTSPMLELAVFAHFFAVPQTDFAQVNTACLSVFGILDKTVGAERIFTLRAGDTFSFDGAFYEVLSPEPADFPFDPLLCDAAEDLNICLASPYHTGCEAEFLRTKDAFINVYRQTQRAFAPSDRASPGRRRILLDTLGDLWNRLEALRGEMERSPAAPDIREILARPVVRTSYTEAQNDLSLVFHNQRAGGPSSADILMTGDVSDAVLARLSPKLFDGYYAVKAPHHGTESHFSPVIGELAVPHLLISNGDYHAGGEIDPRYVDMESIKHCTNCGACRWFAVSNASCNRLQRCFEQSAGGGLTLKCPAAAGNRRTPCSIYVFGHNSVLGCHCDR